MAVTDYGDVLLDYGNHQNHPCPDRAGSGQDHRIGAYLLGIGGDHFVTWPLLKAHAAKHGPLAMVHFDAHQDTWDDDGQRIDHGSFVCRAVREGVIDPKKSIQIGIRTHAPEDFGIKIVHGWRSKTWARRRSPMRSSPMSGSAPTYLTFDIDCLDPAYAPGTGTPVAGGPSSAKILSVLRKLGPLDIRGSDIVEVAPAYDHADITAIAVRQLRCICWPAGGKACDTRLTH